VRRRWARSRDAADYVAFLGMPKPPATLTALYTLLIAFLMVSRLPVFSGKKVRMRVAAEMVLPVFVSVIFFIALLIRLSWHNPLGGFGCLSVGLPLGGGPIATTSAPAAGRQRRPADAAQAGPAPPSRRRWLKPIRINRPTRLN